MYKVLNNEELSKIEVGEGLTIAAVAGIIAIAITVVVLYKLFSSSEASASLPGGYKFEWK
jgi:hypothetical protein